MCAKQINQCPGQSPTGKELDIEVKSEGSIDSLPERTAGCDLMLES